MFLFILTGFFPSDVTMAIAGANTGEVCWSMYVIQTEDGPATATEQGPFIARYRMTHTGGSYFILQGTITVPNDNPVLHFGSAVRIDNEILITMNTSQDHNSSNPSDAPWRDTGTLHIRLDATTLNGTFWQNGLDFNTSTGQFSQEYSAGTVTFTACP